MSRMGRAIGGFLLVLSSGCAGGQANRRVFTYRGALDSPPERAFPLLTPLRENEWIEGWHADVVYSRSGDAEDNAIFATRIATGETWVTTRYEPAQGRVEYTIFGGGHAVMRMDLLVRNNEEGVTELTIVRTYTGLDWFGRRLVSRLEEAKVQEENARIRRQMNHFLTTGTMLRAKG